ncbi:MAG: CapA family protein [Candidatus Saccharibacteria bacterium]|nr:CapA family protein [Candidatus Saccharibacteria bacterium]
MQLKSNTKKKRIIIIVSGLVVVLAASVTAFFVLSNQSKEPANTRQQVVKKKVSQPQTIRLIASGDELPHDAVNKNAKTADGYDYKPFFSEVQYIFDRADIRFCNQEVPSAAPTAGSVSGYPVFNAPTTFADDLSAVGCNVINTATNHSNDKHQAGIDATQNEWDKLKKLAVAGGNRSQAEQDKIRYFTMKGVKFAFLAYNYQSNDNNLTSYGVNMFNEELMKKQLAEAKQNGAYVLVSVHWGTEDSPGIDANQEKWSKFLADNGADVMLGTGPHVLEPVKKLPKLGGGETLVWYSLGNMLNTQLDNGGLFNGFAVMDFTVNKNKPTLKSISFLPTYMHYEWTAQQKAAQDLLARKNLKIYTLDKAAEPLSKSQNNTTVAEQEERIKKTLNTYTTVPIIKSNQY